MGRIEQANYKTSNGKTVTIRTARESDAKEYLILGKAVTAENIYSMTQSEELDFTLEQEKEWLKSNIEKPNHLVLVAEIEKKVIGQLDFSNGHRKRIAHTGEFGMGVHKEYRGIKVGGFLLESLISWAKCNASIEKINLCVHQTNDRAVTMYEKHGFKKEGLRTKDLKYSETDYVDTVLMGLWVK